MVLVALLLVISYPANAQLTKIMGRITDASTGEAVPFANVVLAGTTVGATSDFEGNFTIETRNKLVDTLIASYIGYNTYRTKITRNIFQEINIELQPSEFLLKEVEILPGENPAEIILRNIIANKELNNRQNYSSYQYEVYSKVQFDINNIYDEIKERKILKPFEFVYDYIDTSIVNGKPYLPFFISEAISDVYFQKKPKARKEYIKATKLSGPRNESISQFLGDLYQHVNIYENYIMLFEKNFVSPIADFGLSFYKYYLIDSLYIDDKWCYQVMFKPRRMQELTFTGEFWVNDTSWAIKSVSMKVIKDANINFINNIHIKQDYDKINDQYWMITRDFMLADFNIYDNPKKTLGMFGHKTSTYKNFVFDQPKPREFYNTPLDVYVKDGSFDKTDVYWTESRHEILTEKEVAIYDMIDSIKSLPVFRTWIDAFYLITSGYLTWGPVEVGPLYKTISYNPVEGLRLRIGGRTSNALSKTLMIYGHLAYGFGDDRFKYNIGTLWMLSKNPRRSVNISFLNDLEQLGQSQYAFSYDNLFATVFRRSPANKLSMVQEFKISYEHEWFTGFSNTLNFIHRDIRPYAAPKFIIYNDGQKVEKSSILTSEVRLDLRFAYNEKFIMGEFERVSLGTVYPVFRLQYGMGIPDFLNGEYRYHRLQLGLKHWFNVFSFGWSKYIIEGGKTWGTLPYPLLKLHPGNETFLFDEQAYNLMDYYEFVSDEYLSIFYTHHFDGLFFNRIPLLRKLKWREVIFAQGVVGSVSKKNRLYSAFPPDTYTLKRPYVEIGAGIENIFKVFRIDAIWRLTHLDHPDVGKFAVFLSFQFAF